MADPRFLDHVRRLVGDAEREASTGDWKAARALAEAALALQPDEPSARALLRSAQTALARSGERRQLTVMFCDVVGSTELTGRVDPEVVRDILRSYQSVCEDVIVRYGGHVATYLGDGIVAYFGYPQVHEDDPERAVRAGLETLDAVAELTASVRHRFDLPFEIRLSVHTGLVVRAEMGGAATRDVDAVVGATPTIASRLQEHARPGTLIVSGDTHGLVHQLFTTRPLGALALRGVADPITAFEVLGVGAVDSTAPTMFCDRQAELARLIDAWEAAATGFQLFVITGEPGIGKSRLAEEFRARVEAAGGTAFRAGCSSFHTATPLYPARQLVGAVAGVDSRDEPARVLPPLREALAAVGKEDLLGVFADLLGVRPHTGWEPPQLEGPQLRELTASAMVEWIATGVAGGPVLIVIDDLHWADPSTIDLIGRTVRRHIPGLLLLLTTRDPSPPWSEAVLLPLGPLDETDLHHMADAMRETRALAPTAVERAVRRSEGIPFFLEELIRAADDVPIDVSIDATSTVPAALVSPLLARLGAPGVDLGLCQMMATVGREVDREILAAIVGVPEDVLDARLAVLVGARILEVVPGERAAYRFRHDLLRQLAYETQLRPDRRRLHGAVADVLEALDRYGVPADAAALGYHFEQAGRVAAAVEAYTRQARDSLAHGAWVEGIEQLERCLKLIIDLPDEREQNRLELAVRQVLGIAWATTLGYSSTQAVDEFRRCVELCEVLGPDAGPMPSIEAIWYYYTLRGDLDRADEIVTVDRRRLDLGPNPLPEEGARCSIRLFRGDLRGAIDDLESFLGSRYAQDASGVAVPWPLPDDPIVNSWSFLGMARWWACDPAGSADAFARAEVRAAGLPYPHGPFGLAYLRNIQVLTARIGGLDDVADGLLDELAAISDRHGFAFFSMAVAAQRLIGGCRRGRPASELGGLVAMSQMLGIEVWTPSLEIEEGWAQLREGAADAALARATSSLAGTEVNGVKFLVAEAHRLRGEALLALGDTAASAAELDAAIEVARAQGARLWELRGLISRSRAPDAGAARSALGDLLAGLAGLGTDALPEVRQARELLALG